MSKMQNRNEKINRREFVNRTGAFMALGIAG